MGILDILIHNTRRKNRTLKPVEQSLPEGYRGALSHDADLCTGCHTCASVCSPGAIRVEAEECGILWRYQATRCSFCARCAQYCPTGAIQLGVTAPAVALRAQETLLTEHRIAYEPCARCGKPIVPLPAQVLERLVGPETAASAADAYGFAHLCEKCRSRVTVQRFKDGLTGRRTGGGN